MDPIMRAVVADHLPDDGLIAAPGVVDLPISPARRHDGPVHALEPGSCAAVVLLDDQISRAGDHAEELIDMIGGGLEPGGVLIATVRNSVYAAAAGGSFDGLRGFSAAETASLVAHRGFSVQVLCAPGAAARLRGDDTFDLDADRQPGLLDAAPGLLLIARVFFDTRPTKIAAAGVLCRDPAGRMLVVYDLFKRSWTIPGGVVDAGEDPAAAAVRECWEEAGTKVRTGRLLGVFSARWPDRAVFVFAATPVEVIEHPTPLHPHEIGDVAWLSLDDAIERLAPRIAFQVRRCVDRPGFAWVQ